MSGLTLPKAVSYGNTNTNKIEFSLNNADLSKIAQISKVEKYNEDSMIKSISSWISDNYNTAISKKEINMIDDANKKVLLYNQFNIDLTQKADSPEEAYLMVSSENIIPSLGYDIII